MKLTLYPIRPPFSPPPPMNQWHYTGSDAEASECSGKEKVHVTPALTLVSSGRLVVVAAAAQVTQAVEPHGP